jgi:hypothetical protein
LLEIAKPAEKKGILTLLGRKLEVKLIYHHPLRKAHIYLSPVSYLLFLIGVTPSTEVDTITGRVNSDDNGFEAQGFSLLQIGICLRDVGLGINLSKNLVSL